MLKDDQSLRHLHDARTLLEAAIARQAAKRPTKAFMDELAEILAENEAAIGDRQMFRQSDIAFHRAFSRDIQPSLPFCAHCAGQLVDGSLEANALGPKADRIAHKGHAKVFAAIQSAIRQSRKMLCMNTSRHPGGYGELINRNSSGVSDIAPCMTPWHELAGIHTRLVFRPFRRGTEPPT